MDEIRSFKLKKGQKIDYVNLRKADNGIIVSYTIRIDAPQKSQNSWEDKTEVFTEAQKQEAVNRAAELLRIQAGIED